MKKMIYVNDYTEYPVTARQRSEWFHYAKPIKRFNFVTVSEIENVDQYALKNTFDILVKRHEGLRTTFANINGQIIQRIHNKINYSIDFVDIAKVSNQHDVLQQLYEQFSQFEFNLEDGPLFKIALVRINAVKYKLGFTIDHIISDMPSINILKDEFSFVYSNVIKKQEFPIKPLNFQMKDYAMWEKNYYESDNGQKNLEYWRKKFAKKQEVFSFERAIENIGDKHSGGIHHTFVSNSRLINIEKVFNHPSTLLMAVLFLWLHLLLKNTFIIVSIPFSTRERSELEGVVGYMISDIFLSIDIDLSITFNSFLAVFCEKYAEAISHRHYSYRDLGIDISLYSAAKCSNLSKLKNNFDYSPPSADDGDAQCPYYPVDCTILSYNNGWCVKFNYDKFLFSNKSSKCFEKYIDLLNSVIDFPDEKLESLAIFSN